VKVLVANNMEPFVHGGAEELATHLVANLERHGVEAEVMRIPFRYDPYDGVPQQVAMVRALELFNADRLIALKFPVYALRHPDKVVWLLHQFRQAYDLFPTMSTARAFAELSPLPTWRRSRRAGPCTRTPP
jgi:hypothetical protein